MSHSTSALPVTATPSLRIIRDEEVAPYDTGPVESTGYVTMNNTDVTRTIIGTLGPAYTVYAYLDTYCDTTGTCWPSLDRMADEIGSIGKTTIRRYLAQLEEQGWLRREPRYNKYGMHTGYTYHLPNHTKPANVQGAISAPISRQSRANLAPPQGTELSTELTTKVNPSTSPEREKTAWLKESFDQFIRVYPRCRNEADAKRAWMTVDPDQHVLDQILVSVGHWMNSVEWSEKGGQYIPQADVWLRERKWQFTPTPKPTPEELALIERRKMIG